MLRPTDRGKHVWHFMTSRITRIGGGAVVLTSIVVSALDFRSGGRWLEHSLRRRVVSLDKKLYSTLSLFARVYNWVRLASHPGRVAVFTVASCYRLTGVKHRPDGPPGSCADFKLSGKLRHGPPVISPKKYGGGLSPEALVMTPQYFRRLNSLQIRFFRQQ